MFSSSNFNLFAGTLSGSSTGTYLLRDIISPNDGFDLGSIINSILGLLLAFLLSRYRFSNAFSSRLGSFLCSGLVGFVNTLLRLYDVVTVVVVPVSSSLFVF